MTKLRLALIATVVVAVAGSAFLFLTARPSPRITLSTLRVAKWGDAVSVTFEVLNHTGKRYGLEPVRLEANDGTGWKPCGQGLSGFSTYDDVLPEQAGKLVCLIKQLRSGTRLRLVFVSQRGFKGLSSFILRLKLRLSGQNAGLSLNPFDKVVVFYPEGAEIVSDEFAAP